MATYQNKVTGTIATVADDHDIDFGSEWAQVGEDGKPVRQAAKKLAPSDAK